MRSAQSGPSDANLCHCYACRHSTGLLCISYVSIQPPLSLSGLVSHTDETTRTSIATLHRYFCETCGCHVFRRWTPLFSSEAKDEDAEVEVWEVATGIIVGLAEVRQAADERNEEWKPLLKFAGHVNTASTRDGGLSSFLSHIETYRFEVRGDQGAPSITPLLAAQQESDIQGAGGNDVLEAHCYCKAIRFHITRPDASSRLPHSGFPDLTIPFATSPRELIANPHDEKWWLLPPGHANPSKYLAGTCACRSCRLTSGFEIQTWAFVPRSNIFFFPPASPPSHPPPSISLSPSPAPAATPKPIPLDFATLRNQGVPLKTYDSSPGVQREFCARCGATVFWHDRWRPDLADVSVGLLDAPEGARAESWLEWWCGRVSFEEEAGNGRTGEVARMAKGLVGSLAEGLRRWEGERAGG